MIWAAKWTRIDPALNPVKDKAIKFKITTMLSFNSQSNKLNKFSIAN